MQSSFRQTRKLVHQGEVGRFFEGGNVRALHRVVDEPAANPAQIERLAAGTPRWLTWAESTAELLSRLRRLTDRVPKRVRS
jgi:hypothetical protein